MFTGIIEQIGAVERAVGGPGGGRTVSLRSSFAPGSLALGDSVAVSGVCLTVTGLDGSRFTVDVGPETLARTTLGALAPGGRVNLERALTLSTRLGGHLVQGHVDGVGRIVSISPRENAQDVLFEVPEELLPLIAPQGSITLDGISLTVTRVEGNRAGVMIIPHTWRATTLADRKVGDPLNVEVDLLARYVARLLQAWGGTVPAPAGSSRLTEAFLREHGF